LSPPWWLPLRWIYFKNHLENLDFENKLIFVLQHAPDSACEFRSLKGPSIAQS
jgi:hypothetical protein